MQVIDRVLAKDPVERFSDAAEFAFALRRAVPGFDLTSPLPLPLAPPVPVPVDVAPDKMSDPVMSECQNDDDDRTVVLTDDGADGVPVHPLIEAEWLEAVDAYLHGLYGALGRMELRRACESASSKKELLMAVVQDVAVREEAFIRFLADESGTLPSSTSTEGFAGAPAGEEQATEETAVTPPVTEPPPPAPMPKEERSEPLSDDSVALATAALTDVLGPVAQPLVRRASLRARDFASFVSLCETFIHHQGDLERFRRILATSSHRL